MNERQARQIDMGLEKFKENNEVVPKLEEVIEKEVLNTYGLEEVPDYSLKMDRMVYAQNLGKTYAKIEEQTRKPHEVKLYKKAILIALGVGTITTVLAKTPIDGKIVDFSSNVIEDMIERDNERLDDEYKKTVESVEELTGMTPEEIMNKGKSH